MNEIDKAYLKDHKFRYVENYKPLGGAEHAGDCLIQAVMNSTGKTSIEDWERIYAELYDIGRKQFKVFNHPDVYKEYLEDLGYEVKIVAKKDENYKDYKIKTADFLDEHAEGNYIIGVGRHAFAYIDGIIYDESKDMTSSNMPFIYYTFELASAFHYIQFYAKKIES